MNTKKVLIATIATIAVIGAWAAFRPELLFISKKTNEALPGVTNVSMKGVGPVALSAGSFRGIAHETKGKATVYNLPEGKQILRLSDFSTSNGPDVHVYLVAAKDAADNATVKNAGFIDLGSIKGSEGDQNYDIPANTDLNRYQAVTIWCARFNVNFATAALKTPAN